MMPRLFHKPAAAAVIFAGILFLVLCHPGSVLSQTVSDTLENPAAIRVTVNETSRITGKRILLGEIARIDADPMLKTAISKVELGYAPRPGEIKALEKRRILSALRSEQYLPESLRLVAPDRIYVHREGQRIQMEKLSGFVKDCLSVQFRGKSVLVGALHVRGDKVYPLGDLEYHVEDFDFADHSGRLKKRIDVMVDGRREDTIRITGQISVFDDVVCAADFFEKGKIISGPDLVLLRKNIFSIGKAYFQRKDQVLEKALRFPLRKGEPLYGGMLETVPLVEKGQMVRLAVRKENLTIMTSALSKEDGGEGELVRVENIQSGKTVRGIVKGESLVEVIY